MVPSEGTEIEIRVERLTSATCADFFDVHERSGCGCFCVAWWVPTWVDWGARMPDDNRALRHSLIERGELDGYLAYVGDQPAGWCQVGPRDRLTKLVAQYRLEPDADVWAITCMLLLPQHRRTGIGRAFIRHLLEDLWQRGVRRVQAFPRRGVDLPEDDVWTGPERIFVELGFAVVHEDESWPVLEWPDASNWR